MPLSPSLPSQTNIVPKDESIYMKFGMDTDVFYSECERLGIPADLVQSALEQSQSVKEKWWGGVTDFHSPTTLSDEEFKCAHDEGEMHEEDSPLAHCIKMALMNRDKDDVYKSSVKELIRLSKSEVLRALRNYGGDATNHRFMSALKSLSALHRANLVQPENEVEFEGNWVNISRPNFKGCLGTNLNGDFMYTLGRMSFDMYRPTNVRCSIQKVICKTRPMDEKDEVVPREVPRSLRQQVEELKDNLSMLRTYDIEIHFSIEPDPRKLGKNTNEEEKIAEPSEDQSYRAPSKAIKAIMTNYGYLLPDPEIPMRFTVWFTGGVVTPVPIVVNDNTTTTTSTLPRSSRFIPSMSASFRHSLNSEQILPRRPSSNEICFLSLHDCRRRKGTCAVHGITRSNSEKKEMFVRMNERYYRPRYGPGSQSGMKNPFLNGPNMLSEPFSAEWEDIFAQENTWKRSFSEQVKELGVKLMLGAEVPEGMEDDGTMAFTLHRPIGGHGSSYFDVLYLDKDLRILRGNNGTIYVQSREEEKQKLPSQPAPLPEAFPTSEQQTPKYSTQILSFFRKTPSNANLADLNPSNSAMARPAFSRTKPKLELRRSPTRYTHRLWIGIRKVNEVFTAAAAS